MDLDSIRTDLEQVVRESDATIAVLEAEDDEEPGEISNVDQHGSDTASDISEADREEALVEAAQERRGEAQAALARLDAGSYGLCIDCGDKINEDRLQFRPEASRCLTCQEKFEESDA